MPVHNVTADADTFTCNAYLVDGETTTLVDAGAWPGVHDAIADRVESLEQILITHQHGDHVAELEAIVDRYEPAVLAYGDHPTRTDAIADGDAVQIGDESAAVVHTPGHADDHVSVVSETTLFSGDVVVHNDGAFDDGSFGRTDRPGQSRERLIESLETLLERMPAGVEHCYAGHGDVFHGDVRAIVERALERAKRREPKYPDG